LTNASRSDEVRVAQHEPRWLQGRVDVSICDTSGGCFETPLFPHHNAGVQLATPLVATRRRDALLHRYLQVAGDIDVAPACLSETPIDEGSTTVLILSLSPSVVRAAAKEMGLSLEVVSIQPLPQPRNPQADQAGSALEAELEAYEPHGRLYADNLDLALAAHLLRRCAPTASGRTERGLSKRRLKRVVDYVHEHLAQDLSLIALARVADMSPSHFKVLFKQSVGVPVHQYVIRSRVQYAIELLIADRLPLKDIALQAGFADQSHMARCVRRLTGMAPSALKRNVS